MKNGCSGDDSDLNTTPDGQVLQVVPPAEDKLRLAVFAIFVYCKLGKHNH